MLSFVEVTVNFGTSEIFAIIYLNLNKEKKPTGNFVKMMKLGKQTVKTLIRLLIQQSDLGLHCLPRPIWPKSSDRYLDEYLFSLDILACHGFGIELNKILRFSPKCQIKDDLISRGFPN